MISFIVIGKNEGWRLEKCLISVLNVVGKDSITDYELIYVDSKSLDDSLKLAKKYTDNVYLIKSECNAAVGRNIGAIEAKGDILFFIDGDMEVQPGFLPKVMRDGKELIYPFVSGVWNDSVYDIAWNYLYSIDRAINAKDKTEQTTGGLFIIEAKLWNKKGGMDTRLKRHQDLDIGIRLTKLGYPLHRKKELLAIHHTTAYNDRREATSYYKYTAVLLRKHLFSKYALRVLLFNQYTSVAFVISLLMAVSCSWWCTCLYLLAILYRTMKAAIRQKKRWSSLFRLMIQYVKRDFVFIFSLFTFFPSKVELIYQRV